MDNLINAHKKARKGKTHYKEVKMVDNNKLYYLSEIQKMLKNKTYKTSNYEMFTKVDKGKEREIFKLPYYPDRIVQTAIMLQIEDVFMNAFIDKTYAALPQKGIHKALSQLDEYLKNKGEVQYCLKIDVKKFFPNMDKAILKKMLRRKFKDKDLLWLLDDIVDSHKENGVPIGNYTSQYFGNFYLSYFDHWLKEDKKVKYYLRYMDDIVILHHDKRYLHQIRKEIEHYLNNNLSLRLKENWQVFPTFVRGVDFVGYRHFGSYVLLRKSTEKAIKRKMRDISNKLNKGKHLNYSEWCSVNSYLGWSKWANTYNLTHKFILPIMTAYQEYYNTQIKRSDYN